MTMGKKQQMKTFFLGGGRYYTATELAVQLQWLRCRTRPVYDPETGKPQLDAEGTPVTRRVVSANTKAVVRVAKKCRIPVRCVPHGVVGVYQIGYGV